MTFSKYKVRPLQKFTSSLWNSVMDELDLLSGGVGVIKDIEPKIAELYEADITEEQEIELDIGGFKIAGVLAVAEAPTIFMVDFSFDGDYWFNYYTSSSPETTYMDVFITVARYVRLRSSPVNEPGKKVTLIIGAKP